MSKKLPDFLKGLKTPALLNKYNSFIDKGWPEAQVLIEDTEGDKFWVSTDFLHVLNVCLSLKKRLWDIRDVVSEIVSNEFAVTPMHVEHLQTYLVSMEGMSFLGTEINGGDSLSEAAKVVFITSNTRSLYKKVDGEIDKWEVKKTRKESKVIPGDLSIAQSVAAFEGSLEGRMG